MSYTNVISIDDEELKRMALVGGSDGDPGVNPCSLPVSPIATLTVSLVSVTSVSIIASLSTETFCSM